MGMQISISRRRVLVLVLMACLLLGAVALGYWMIKRLPRGNEASTDYSRICYSDSVGTKLHEIYADSRDTDTGKINETLQEIEHMNNAKSAPNCLFAMGRLSVMLGRHRDASRYYHDLLEIYEQENIWVHPATTNLAPEDVERLVALYENSDTLFLNTARFNSGQ